MQAKPKAVVLLSGRLDSATTLTIASSQGFDVHALTFRYGQRHDAEVAAAQRVARHLRAAEHRVIMIDLRAFGGSALTDDVPVPNGRTPEAMGDGIPVTYVPARNTIFLSYALAWGEVLGAGDVFLGINALDHSGYPDCRPAYVEAFERMANLATKAAVEGSLQVAIHTPLIQLTKAEIIRTGLALGVDYGLTSSCYDPALGKACGQCDACQLRLEGFVANGVSDPAPYVPNYRVAV
jgi:7-cyano-7-deazaguanine synthase